MSALAAVQEALAAVGEASPIGSLEREPSLRSSSYRTEILTIGRPGSPDLRVFLKDFGVCKQRKPNMAERRWRELCVYRDLLAGADLGTPAYHGAVWDEPGGRFWLLIEYVEGRALRDLRFEHWVQAARWLGRLQGRFADRDLAAGGFLAEHDAGFYAAAVADARRALRAISASLGARLDTALRGHEEQIPAMADEPRTLVHGVYRPYNILVRDGEPGGICATDWEEAARGSALYDLACLSDGFHRARLAILIDGYEEERARAGLPRRDRERVLRDLAWLQVHRNLRTLAKAHERAFPVEGVAKLVARVEALAGGRAVIEAASAGAADASASDTLGALIERLVGARVTAVSAEPSPFVTVSPAEVVTVRLETGATLTLFVKRLGSEQADHPDKFRRDREPNVYRHLLAGHDLPAPTFYGSLFQPRSGRYELVLEHVDDWSLKYHGLEHWRTAAGRLGALHAHFARRADELSRADFLLRLDHDHFAGWAERALAGVAAMSADLGRAAQRALRHQAAVVDALADQPPTLVHNDLAPKNVIADTSTRPARIRIVDWEMAGVGCGLLDLAHLAHGLPPREALRLQDAYLAGLDDGRAPGGRELRRRLAACEFLNAVHRLAHVREWGIAPVAVAGWIDELRRLQRAV